MVASLGLLSIVGCFGKGEGPTGTVTGNVTFNGQPATEGRVAFISAQGKGASGIIGAQGEYTLKTIAGDQIPVGEYQVAVQPPPAESRDASSAPSEVPQATPGRIMKGAPGDPIVKEYPNIPMQYRNPSTSGWKVTVKEGANQFDFEMKR